MKSALTNLIALLLIFFGLLGCGGSGGSQNTGQTENRAPTASFSLSANPVEVGESVSFNSANSSDPDSGDTLSFAWQFGDGGTSQAANPSHQYSAAGTYLVTLIVTDNLGLSSNPSSVNLVVNEAAANRAPIASFTSIPNPTAINMPVSFNSSNSSDPDIGDTLSFSWQFGDGTTSESASPSHAYSTAGSYNASLIVTDNHGLASSSATTTIIVNDSDTNTPPVASFTATPNPAEINASVNFDSSASFDPDAGDTLTFVWQFGDGNTSQATNPSHSYADAGSYDVQLVVTDDQGLASQPAIVALTVNDSSSNSQPIASFTAAPNPTEVAVDVSFNSNGSSDPDTGDTLTFAWQFGDGSSSQTENPSHAYQAEGSYQASLVVTDNHGLASDPFNLTIDVSAASQYSGQPEPWPTTRDLNIIWFGASTTAYVASSNPSYDIPLMVKQIYAASLPSGEVDSGVHESHTDGGTSLNNWLASSSFSAVENGPAGSSGNWDYVIATSIKHMENFSGDPDNPEFPVDGTRAIYDALVRVDNSSRADQFVNYIVPRLNNFYQTDIDSEALITRYECVHVLAREATAPVLNSPVALAMDSVYRPLPDASYIQRLKTYPQFPASFPDSFDESVNLFVFDANPSGDQQHYAQPGAFFVANVFAVYLYGINPIGLPLMNFSGFCANTANQNDARCKISDNLKVFLQAVAYDTVTQYRLGERSSRNGLPIDCDVEDQITIDGMREDAYLNGLFGG